MIVARETKTGRRYDVRLRDPSGKVYTRTFRTRRDAETWAARELADRSRGAWVDPRRGNVTLAEWAGEWMVHRSDLRPRTRELYQGLLDHHILPSLGDTRLSALRPSHIRSWYSELRGSQGPGQSTAAKSYRLLRAVLLTAVTDEIIARSPCQIPGAGIERAPERPLAAIADVEALTAAISPRFRALVLLAARCGLRRGELLGLQRNDLDLDAGVVRVERSMHQLADGTLVIGPPKTDAGRRKVAIPPHLRNDLAAHLDSYVALAPEALVFTGERGGPLRPHVLQKAWVTARRATGSDHLHLHDLRHAGNTWAAATGASTKELMSRMGHANSAAALRYQHATASRDQAIAQALSALAGRPRDQRAMTTPPPSVLDDGPSL